MAGKRASIGFLHRVVLFAHVSRLLRRAPIRVLVFNCTSGRSGRAFLSTMFETVTAQLSTYPPKAAIPDLFDRVIFSTNVTYADGKFKGGQSRLACFSLAFELTFPFLVQT